MATNPNSIKVTVYRSGSFLARAQGPEIEDYFQMAKKSIGSYWEGENSTKVASGLSYEEQALLMPLIINCDADDKGFRKEVEAYFHEIDTKVPHNTGVTLEIGLLVDNSKPISKTNMPISPENFVRYRHLRFHPQVALSKKEAEGNPLKEFYVFNPTDVKIKERKNIELADSAMQIYLALKQEITKIDPMLVLLKIDPRSLQNKEDKMEKLRLLAIEKPDEFTKAYQSTDLTIRYWIENMVFTGVFVKIGEKYIDAESKATIGHNITEAISYFLDKENSEKLVIFKAKMQEAANKPIEKDNPAQRKTQLTAKQIS